ncbi:hypothetical protein T4C_864, partial [Trichinella pseudospiralis]
MQYWPFVTSVNMKPFTLDFGKSCLLQRVYTYLPQLTNEQFDPTSLHALTVHACSNFLLSSPCVLNYGSLRVY